jgi:hypothetical protein
LHQSLPAAHRELSLYSLWRIITLNVSRSLCIAYLKFGLNKSDFAKNLKTRNLMKFRPLGAALLHADRPLERAGRIWRG